MWWALLTGSLLLAAAHLASMLSTGWGDRGTGTKSFLFSVVFHVALLCAVFAAKPSIDRMLGETGDRRTEPNRRFQVGSLRLDAAEAPAADRVPEPWRSIEPTSPRALSRSDLPDRAVEEVERNRDRAADPPADFTTPLETADRLNQPLPAPDRPDAVPDPLAPTLDPSPGQPAPVDAPIAALPDLSPTPRPLARRTLPSADATFQPIPRRERAEPDPFAAEMTLTERANLVPDLPRRATEDGPQPTEIDSPVSPAAPDVASLLPLPMLPDDPEVPESLEAPDPDRLAAPSLADLATATPRRTRPALPMESLDPLAASGLSERRNDLLPRPDPGERRDDGPQAVVTNTEGPRAPGVPDAYRLRDLSRRTEIAKQYGGTTESEEAVEAALAWFARSQEAAGYWDASEHGAGSGSDNDPVAEPDPDKRNTGRDADAGLTGLVTLSFLGAGYTRTGGKYAPAVDKAVRWLVAQQKEDGSLTGDANYYARMYSHGIAAYALAEALALEGDRPDPALRRAVEKAVAYIVAEQYPDGGWRYSQRVRVGDMSMFGWQVMALKSAENAGVPTPPETRARMINFLRDRSETVNADGELVQYPYGGLARYKREEGHAVKPSMTAEALFCKQILGLRRDQPAAKQAVEYLDRFPPELRTWNLYHWYYASLALHHHGGPEWERWNQGLRELLLEEQYKEGPQAGAWPVRPMRHNYTEYGGMLYSTAMATLCLEVYYRFSPASGGAAAMDGRADAEP
ncbi:Prenyltransferase and squalene oxidase repeat protein [Alienimonas californiensis]|uniref:Prenyltransferase and squalene oxidase repeat protein n=2 Tax=Alienimonas californiensis TaxID=2527989 RepID=A0A517P932_9PLAN|nr:Prenyltransferase and squalene oxidase repeat protein [Alienimonas californiensis]